MPKALSAQIFVALMIVSGFLLVGKSVLNVHSMGKARFLALVVVAIVAARLKVKLPGITGTMSVNLPFILLAVALLSTAEATIVSFISTFAQCLPRDRHKLNPVQLAFNCSLITLSATVARLIYVSPAVDSWAASAGLRLALSATGYFLVNTATVSLVISLTEKTNLLAIWKEMFQLSFAYLVASAGVASLALTVDQEFVWQVPLAVLLVMLGVFSSYRRYFAVAIPVANSQLEGAAVTSAAHV